MNLPLSLDTWGRSERKAIKRVLKSGQITMGSQVKRLEHMIQEKFQVKHCIMVNSGSSANLIAATALALLRGNEVRNEIIVPTVSWSTTYYPWTQNGFRLKFVDVDPNNFCLTAENINKAIDDKTIGVCLVHLLGNLVDMQPIVELCQEKGIFLVEDSCEAFGSVANGKFSGTFGDIGTFSSYFSHHISTGEGGFLVTNDDVLADYSVALRAHGWLRNLPYFNHVAEKTGNEWLDQFRFYLPGYNVRPTELQAAPGIIQLNKLDSFLRARKLNAQYLVEKIQEIPWIKLQIHSEGSSWFAFGFVINEQIGPCRNEVIEKISKNGIASRPLVTGNFLANPVVKLLDCVNSNESFPVSENIELNAFMIGNHALDIHEQLLRFVNCLKEISA